MLFAVIVVPSTCHCKCTHSKTEWRVCCILFTLAELCNLKGYIFCLSWFYYWILELLFMFCCRVPLVDERLVLFGYVLFTGIVNCFTITGSLPSFVDHLPFFTCSVWELLYCYHHGLTEIYFLLDQWHFICTSLRQSFMRSQQPWEFIASGQIYPTTPDALIS